MAARPAPVSQRQLEAVPDPLAHPVRRSSSKATGRKITPKSQATRLQILASAARIFATHGYGLTRLAAIAQAADMHLTSLYYYYDNKAALANDLLAYASQRNSQALQAALDQTQHEPSWRIRIETAVDAHVQSILRQDDFMRAYIAIVSQVAPAVREQALLVTRRDGERWRVLLEGAVLAGEISPDIDLAMTRMALLGAMNWAVEWFDPLRGDPSQLSNAIKTLVFKGVVPNRS